jgi:hypothetical protein
MDYKSLGISSLAVMGIISVAGTIISVLSTQLQCSKIGFTTSLKQGILSAIGPTIVYAVSVAFLVIRSPFAGTFSTFGVPDTLAPVLGVGYLTMLMFWVTIMWNIHNSEKTVCQADVKEMTDFKKKLLAELQEKELAKEKHAEKK